MFRFPRKTLCMMPGNPIFACLKALWRLAMVCALVLLPPAATHAGTGMHGGQHGVAAGSEQAVAHHAAAAVASHVLHAGDAEVKADDGNQAPGQCCSGVCVSVVLAETGIVFVEQAGRDRFLRVDARPESTEPAGFLRPPLYLI